MAATVPTRKIVVLGAGFVGSHIVRALAQTPSNRIQISSRAPQRVYDTLLSSSGPFKPKISEASLLPPVKADVTSLPSLVSALAGAQVVVSLVGILSGSTTQFEEIQWHGVRNVVRAAKEAGVRKIVHLSAIGADPSSPLDYFRTKALAEMVLLESGLDVSILRPSLVFGEGDGFFQRFATLSRVMPFLPVFGGGTTKFQPVFAGDLGRAVDALARGEDGTKNLVIQAGGPEVLTYKEMMLRILKTTGRWRPVVSLPFAVGYAQGMVLERLPENILTVTRAQVEQLKQDNITLEPKSIPSRYGERYTKLEEFLATRQDGPLRSLDEVLPTYLK